MRQKRRFEVGRRRLPQAGRRFRDDRPLAAGAVVLTPGEHLVGHALAEGQAVVPRRAFRIAGQGVGQDGVETLDLLGVEPRQDAVRRPARGRLHRRARRRRGVHVVDGVSAVDGVDGVVDGGVKDGQVACGHGRRRAVLFDGPQGRLVPHENGVVAVLDEVGRRDVGGRQEHED